MELLEQSYFASDVSVPIFATGFADVITWEENKYVGIVEYRKSDVDIYPFQLKDLLEDLANLADIDSSDTVEFLDNSQYDKAVKLFGSLEYDECFGYVPLLALGGAEKVEKLQKMKIKPHIDIITQTAGRIE